MRNRGYVPDSGDVKPGTLERADRCLTATTGAFNVYLHLPQAMFHSLPGGITGCQLRRIWRTFTRTLEAGGAGASPSDDIPLWVGKGHYRIIKR